MNEEQVGIPRHVTPVVYANDINLQMSLNDFCLSFNLALPANRLPGTELKRADVPIETQAVVYLSPVQAKALRDLLDQHIEAYEARSKMTLPVVYGGAKK